MGSAFAIESDSAKPITSLIIIDSCRSHVSAVIFSKRLDAHQVGNFNGCEIWLNHESLHDQATLTVVQRMCQSDGLYLIVSKRLTYILAPR